MDADKGKGLVKQVTQANRQGPSYALNYNNSRIFDHSLDTTNVSPVQSALASKHLLRPAARLAQSLHVHSQSFSDVHLREWTEMLLIIPRSMNLIFSVLSHCSPSVRSTMSGKRGFGMPNNGAAILSVMILLVATASIGHAASKAVEARYSPSLNECIDHAGYADFAMTDCYDAELSVQDGRLNQAYKMVMTRLSPQRKTELRNAERAWIKKRDLNCELHAAPEAGGTLYNVMLSSCLVNETIQRTIVLEKY